MAPRFCAIEYGAEVGQVGAKVSWNQNLEPWNPRILHAKVGDTGPCGEVGKTI
jgi:hypothetical protein